MKTTTFFIKIGTKCYPIIVDFTGEILNGCELVHVKCEGARINQDYPKEDLPLLLQDIEELIRSEQLENKNTNINIRVKSKEKLEIQKYAQEAGYKTLSEYVLARALHYA